LVWGLKKKQNKKDSKGKKEEEKGSPSEACLSFLHWLQREGFDFMSYRQGKGVREKGLFSFWFLQSLFFGMLGRNSRVRFPGRRAG